MDLDKARQADSATRPPSTPAPCRSLEKALRESGAMERGFDGELRLTPKAMRQARQGAAARRRREDVGPAGPARPAPGRCGRRPVRGDPGLGVR
ncbi:hypothetical protein [Nocardioides convexus]|uniref:hypothetical protein n=1 Tax=Nocardioides convexus TaxID=2712224 RepID=UPI00241854AB|nr:hypothetical protein [Nocardioides convexus]